MNSVITPGQYKTRSGRKVTIHDCDGSGTFPVRGSLWSMFRGSERPREFAIWMLDGRYNVLEEHNRDLVERISDD